MCIHWGHGIRDIPWLCDYSQAIRIHKGRHQMPDLTRGGFYSPHNQPVLTHFIVSGTKLTTNARQFSQTKSKKGKAPFNFLIENNCFLCYTHYANFISSMCAYEVWREYTESLKKSPKKQKKTEKKAKTHNSIRVIL